VGKTSLAAAFWPSNANPTTIVTAGFILQSFPLASWETTNPNGAAKTRQRAKRAESARILGVAW
jgi:hypothetical protein